MHRSPDTFAREDDARGAVSTPVTISVTSHTRDLLDSLKKSPNESYDDVISRLSEKAGDEAPLSDETLREIEKSLAELRKGISRTHEEIVQELISKKEE